MADPERSLTADHGTAPAGRLRAALIASVLAAAVATVSLSAAVPARSASRYEAASTSAGLLSIANAIRARGCAGRAGVGAPLRSNPELDDAAERLARGAALGQATTSAGYRATRSASLQISGDLSDEAVARLFATRFCTALTDPTLRDIGLYRQGSQLWVLAAAPFAAPELSNPALVAARVLELVNAARAGGRRCGYRHFGPARPLTPSARLREAALAHSRDMAAHSYLDHVGRDGSTPGLRVTRTGYVWQAVGENIAAGPTGARDAVAGWLASPAHCANIMDPDFTQTAVAYAVDPKSRMGVYWTEVFAAPMSATKGRARRR